MGEASAPKHIDLATFLEIPIDKEPQTITATHALRHTLSPAFRLSPSHNGSTLYDSYELRAVTHQLNKAFQGSKTSSSPHYMFCYNSPFYRQGLSRICKESATTPKKILCSRLSCATTGEEKPRTRPAAAVSKGFVTRAWRKVKQGFMKNNKQRNER